MDAITATETRNRLKEVLQRVVDDCEPILITRSRGRESVVIISQREYDSLAETAYLLSEPANAAHLLASIAEADAGKSEPRDLINPNA